MINITKTPNYETLKTAFKDGIEFKMTPFEKYFKTKFLNPAVDNETMANVTKKLYTGNDPLKMLLSKTLPLQPDLDKLTGKVAETAYTKKIANEGYYKISDTFNKGKTNPVVCFMAWYDALAEYVLAAARSLIGEQSPIPVIQAKLNELEKKVITDNNYTESKTAVYESLKKLYPKTYKKRLKLLEQNYNKKVQTGVTDIVRKMLYGK